MRAIKQRLYWTSNNELDILAKKESENLLIFPLLRYNKALGYSMGKLFNQNVETGHFVYYYYP